MSQKCEKAGCNAPAEVVVSLTDVDFEYQWAACVRHADEFEEWVFRESLAAGERATSVSNRDGMIIEIHLVPSKKL